ncbi:hypothetical protein IscW_ISCW011228 [Ixodes scapularis]|uniref:Uncharacterized protein n=1 Tax=Ixodes scapularis TaxID=6945 RepID=B7Q8D8_IXOSC|nr:hypothetical protein IscW_ISCW011228 [Ixodes scapularis]|eukprot:XP_002412347.1 hypothetical protein IscW_ISCW011228 [Ixodes scapularis]
MLPSCIALLGLMLSTFPATGAAVSSTSASPTATKDMEAKESSKSLVTLTPPSITQSASYQYGYEVGTVDSTLFKGQAKEQGGLTRGTYAYKDDSGQYRQVEYVANENGYRASISAKGPKSAGNRVKNLSLSNSDSRKTQVEDKAPTPTAATFTTQTDSVLQKLKQSDKAQVFFEPKAPTKEEASSLITSYEIPRASAIPKKGQANNGEATSNAPPKPAFFDQPAKVERKVVVTSGGGGSLPLTQRQQKRVTVIHKSAHSEQSSDKSRSSPRTFTKTFRGPQYRPTLRPQVRQQIQQQLQQQQHQAQQPFLFGRPDALQQMLKQQQQQQFFMPQNQGFQKIITQGPVPIELKVEPLYDMNKGVGHNIGIKDAFPGATSVKVNDKMNVQVAGLLVNNQGLFPKHLLQGIGKSQLRFNEPLNVHIPIGELPPRPAVNVRIKGPDGKISQVLVPLHDAVLSKRSTFRAFLSKLEPFKGAEDFTPSQRRT